MIRLSFRWLLLFALLAVSSSLLWAQSENTKSFVPILMYLLADKGEATFSENAEIHIGEQGLIHAFVGKDIDAVIVVTENGVNTTSQYRFELISGPTGLTITPKGEIHFIPTAVTPPGSHTVTIKIVDKVTGAEKTTTFTVFVMETEIVATGNIGPEGGIVADDWEDVVLHVPSGAVSVLSTFAVLRGINEDLIYVYTVQEPADVTKALSIRLPHPELRVADHDPYPLIQPITSALSTTRSIATLQPGSTSSTSWNKWTSRPANYATIDTGIGMIKNRLRNDSEELQPAGLGVYNSTQTATRLYSLCPESSSEYASSYCADKAPVLFIHGFKPFGEFSGGSDYWGQLRELISEQGYAVFEFTWRTNARFVDVANDLASAIRKINKKSGRKVHIVAHSFGGLLARTYLQDYAQLGSKTRKYDDNVQSLVTIGAPHSGIFDSATDDGFPKGQDNLVPDNLTFEVCQQISCNQAGEPTPNAWTSKYLGYHDYSEYFGVNNNKEAGELIRKLDATKDALPIDTFVLMGLVTSTSYSTQYYKNGDNLITFAGQRFDKTWRDSQTQPEQTLVSGAQFREKIMGFGDSDMHPTAAPGKVVSSQAKAHMTDSDKPFTGYYHSNGTKQKYGTHEVFVENTENISGLDRPHAALTEIKRWLLDHSSDPATVSSLSLTITVVDAEFPATPVSGAQVTILVGGSASAEGVTDANGQLVLETPFIPNTVYAAIVTAADYHPDTHDTGYRSGATVAESGTDFGTILLQSDTVAHGSLGGQVTDADTGLPLAGVSYTMLRNTVRIDGTTDLSGNYYQSSLVRGRWLVTFSKPGYTTTTYTFDVNPGVNTRNATLSRGGNSPLNDTGITWGGDYPSGNNTTCTSNISSPQDCHQGRDFTHNDDSDGHAGFSYTKISSTGAALPASATEWSCVKDNVTGLIWEVKTDDGGIHDKDNTYRWGGKTHLGSGYGTYYDDWDSLVDGSNSENLCGFSDWRVPTIKELENLASFDRINPAIDTGYFPNTQALYFWSASPSAVNSGYAWDINFYFGDSYGASRYHYEHVRLVRDGQ